MTLLSPGSPAPDFLLSPSADTPPRRLSDLRGRPVLLAFSPPGWDPARAAGLTQINRIFAQSGFSGEMVCPKHPMGSKPCSAAKTKRCLC